jgi:hypothetical protein
MTIIKAFSLKAIQQINVKEDFDSKDTPEGSSRSLKGEARRLHSTPHRQPQHHIENTSEDAFTIDNIHTHSTMHHKDMISETL